MKTWDERANNYLTWKEGVSPYLIKRNIIYNPLLHFALDKKIRQIQPQTLLEIGCGPGRLFDLYRGIQTTCIDSSANMLERAKALCKHYGYTNITLYEMDACNMRFDTFFDVAITSNLLLHIPHEKIDAVISGIQKYAIHVVCVEWVDKTWHDVGNCYLHDYIHLFNKHGFTLVSSKKILFEKQMMYHFRRKK